MQETIQIINSLLLIACFCLVGYSIYKENALAGYGWMAALLCIARLIVLK